jgi:hypothetical protein
MLEFVMFDSKTDGVSVLLFDVSVNCSCAQATDIQEVIKKVLQISLGKLCILNIKCIE